MRARNVKSEKLQEITVSVSLSVVYIARAPVVRLGGLAPARPITTCEAEHTVSCLRRLKTYMRSTMGQDRLTGLAVMHIHCQIDVDIDDTKYSRRMQLVNCFGLMSVCSVNSGLSIIIVCQITSSH